MAPRPRDETYTQQFSLDRPNEWTKIDLTPRRYHFFNVLLFIFGTVFPPLAVAARFGIGTDFWLNIVLTILGYFPGHGHNFYIQNIRNNKNHRRTPKWAIRYGLVDDSEIRRKAKRSQWASRYNERLPRSTLEGEQYAEGQVPDRTPEASTPEQREAALWRQDEDESFYGQKKKKKDVNGSVESGSSSGGGRWHYPANFEDAVVEDDQPKKKKSTGLFGGKKKKNRWELSEDARAGIVPDGPVVDGYDGRKKKKKEKKVKRKKKGTVDDTYVDPSLAPDTNSIEDRSRMTRTNTDTTTDEGPEDAVGGLYGPSRPVRKDPVEERKKEEQHLFDHQF